MLTMNKIGFFPYTPATQMLHGLTVAIDMLHEEGLDNVFTRHARFAEATRRAVRTWGLEILCRDPKYYSPTVTAVLLPEGHDADKLRSLALDHFDISYGASFGKLTGKYFRIGHLGDTNDLTILGALAGTEMALTLAGVPIKKGGVQAAMDYIVSVHGGGGAAGVTQWRRADDGFHAVRCPAVDLQPAGQVRAQCQGARLRGEEARSPRR
jgi:alanine-glyoxylate transaminase/serine-glyoxylate transaminase/serine-pyruvate transaminase